MFLQCPSCLEPREVQERNCRKCGVSLPILTPCSDCGGKGYLDSGDGPEDCVRCDGLGAVL